MTPTRLERLREWWRELMLPSLLCFAFGWHRWKKAGGYDHEGHHTWLECTRCREYREFR